MQSKATTVAKYLAELPADRRAAIEAVRSTILANLDTSGYEEGMQYGMIGYYVPHRVYPAGYHCDPKQPLPYVCLASQKNHMALYMMGLYCGCTDGVGNSSLVEWFQTAWTKTGKKLDMGKSCIRFKKLDDLPLEVIGEAIRRTPAKTYIAVYEQAYLASRTASSKSSRKSASKASASKTSVSARAEAQRTAKSVAKSSAAKPGTKKVAAKSPTAKKSTTNKAAARR